MSAEQVRDFVAETLSARVTAVPRRFPRGFGNDNWRVATTDGDLVVKLAHPHLPGEKLLAAARAQRLAADAGVPVPELIMVEVASAAFDGRAVRVQEFVPGRHPAQALTTREAIDDFFRSAGTAIARLHSVQLDAFASRVGGSPNFPSWVDYVRFRLPQIAARVEVTGGFPGLDLDRLFTQVVDVAREVSTVVSPTLTHRDLYPDNLLVAPDGSLATVLDFDLAEAWDPVVDLVKMRWLVESAHPGATRAFLAGYGIEPDLLAPRLWVAEVMELVNTIANALPAGDDQHAMSARTRLDDVLAHRDPA